MTNTLKFLDDVKPLDPVEREYAIRGCRSLTIGFATPGGPAFVLRDGTRDDDLTKRLLREFAGVRIASESARRVADWVRAIG